MAHWGFAVNRTLPPYEPPSRDHGRAESFPAYLKQLEQWLDRFQNYTKDYIQQLTSVVNTGAQGFATQNVAVASTVNIGAYTTIMTGTGTISTIATSPGFSGQIHLIAQSGFSTDTAGNINAAVVVPAGASILFDYNPVTQKFYANLGE